MPQALRGNSPRSAGGCGARSALDCSSLLELLGSAELAPRRRASTPTDPFPPSTGSKLPPPQSSSKLEQSKALRAR